LWPPLESWSAPASLSTVTFRPSLTTVERFDLIIQTFAQQMKQLLFPGGV